MLVGRIYNPGEEDILYHYCSPEAFMAIIQTGCIRFTDVNMLNDYLEMHWGYRKFEEAASELLAEIPKEFFDEVDKIISGLQKKMLPFVSCLSTKSDVLSQWRSYALDGTGYAIGFRAKELINLPVRPLIVSYSEREQIDELKISLKVLFEGAKENNLYYNDEEWFTAAAVLAADICSLKNPAFQEESEVRLVHLVDVNMTKEGIFLKDVGGTDQSGKPIEGSEIGFRDRGSCITAYLDLKFRGNWGDSLCEVVSGPKNGSAPTNIMMFVCANGYNKVSIKRSAASYR